MAWLLLLHEVRGGLEATNAQHRGRKPEENRVPKGRLLLPGQVVVQLPQPRILTGDVEMLGDDVILDMYVMPCYKYMMVCRTMHMHIVLDMSLTSYYT